MMYSISEIADKFSLTTRTIRYYEELGLIKPQRSEGGRRFFTSKEVTRIKLILRGKRFGFSLDEIKEMIQLFDQDSSGKKQLERTIEYGKQKIKEVNKRIDELKEMKQELEELQNDFLQNLMI
ncbi:DNA-binding transcriptional MerR regulator [Bacillus pakistanensis]|uniref:DNA-binding transcriptional MerR regulator n=1 Tax=Rossellomorea pakistanensis TaxID=992288 RepID=A0ABS2N800_9BACI|nr:MerR family DNA-binding transcriptional regulator [Bacillus pakistanensis]MBM7583985.1 DNA-binding transcriptional MerR regulator [Bacillus pakistanensis]